MDYYFDWYKIFDKRKVRVATESARVYWSSVERDSVRNTVLIETGDEMKDILKEKYFPQSYSHHLLDELHRLRQGSMSVQAYITAFDGPNFAL